MPDKIFLLGSECYTNMGLTRSCLANAKVRYSPFHGTRVLRPGGVCPVVEFFTRYNAFKDAYLDPAQWEWHMDGTDRQGWNVRLNLRKCHLDGADPFRSIVKTRAAFDFFESDAGRCAFVLDLNDYMVMSDRALDELRLVVEDRGITCAVRQASMRDSLVSIQKTIGQPENVSRLPRMWDRIMEVFSPVVLGGQSRLLRVFQQV